jgi:hypothetical protein
VKRRRKTPENINLQIERVTRQSLINVKRDEITSVKRRLKTMRPDKLRTRNIRTRNLTKLMGHDRTHTFILQKKAKATMALHIELPKDILTNALDQAVSLRSRQSKAANNSLIKQALEQEIAAITTAKNTIAEIK